MLVSYSDSEGSDNEPEKPIASKPTSKDSTAQSNSSFAIDKSTGKIKVNLQNKPDPSLNGVHEDEPAAKRPRLGDNGASAFSGFNALLPPPKRDNLSTQGTANKASARKVFSLKTGAEPAFSREADVELRELFAGQDTGGEKDATIAESTIPVVIPKPAFAKPAPPAAAGKPFLFKPLSVARNTKKKKSATSISAAPPVSQLGTAKQNAAVSEHTPEPPKKKISLFSSGTDASALIPTEDEDDEIVQDLGPAESEDAVDFAQDSYAAQGDGQRGELQPQSLDSIASDLNLTAAEKRQLFGRGGRASANSAFNVVNFNTDAEYAANQQLIASGEQVQHNPVRAIASGKHSLRQLVSSATIQKDALEESFAQGKRNKKEAGNKYGW